MFAILLPFLLASVGIVGVSSMIFYKYYIHSNESSKIAMIIFTFCNTISYFCFICLTINSYTNILHDEQSEEVYKKIHLSEKLLIIDDLLKHLIFL